MDMNSKDKETVIRHMIDQQLNDPDGIRMSDGTTFVYRFQLNPAEAVCLGLSPQTAQADIFLDLMMEFMKVYGLDANGEKTEDGEYPTEVKGPYIRRIFDLYGQKARKEKEEKKEREAQGSRLLTEFLVSESVKQVRRFYLNYPVADQEGNDLHLYIETEVDEDDSSYLNYWVGCEEFTQKDYIASCQAPLDQERPLDIVQVRHLESFIRKLKNRKQG